MTAIELLLVEDQRLFRHGLSQLLEAEGRWRVTAAASAEEAQQLLSERSFALMVTDLTLPERDGLWLVSWTSSQFPGMPCVVFTNHRDQAMLARTLETGALGYVLKSSEPTVFIASIESALKGERFQDPSLGAPIVEERPPSLSLFELEMLQLFRRGWSRDQVRKTLKLSPPSFASRLRSIFRKLGVEGLDTALSVAFDRRLLVPDTH